MFTFGSIEGGSLYYQHLGLASFVLDVIELVFVLHLERIRLTEYTVLVFDLIGVYVGVIALSSGNVCSSRSNIPQFHSKPTIIFSRISVPPPGILPNSRICEVS